MKNFGKTFVKTSCFFLRIKEMLQDDSSNFKLYSLYSSRSLIVPKSILKQ